MKKRKIKKRVFLYLLLFVILCLFIIKPRGYHKEYSFDVFNIYEEYNDNKYYFKISSNDYIFDYYVDHKRLLGKKRIKDIKVYQNDLYTCIVPSIYKLDSIPLCYGKTSQIDYHLVNNDMKDHFSFYFNEDNTNITTYNNINIYDLVNKSYLVWNYHNLINITKNKNEEIKLFDNDYYDVSLGAVVGNYYIIPDYDEEYNFNTFKIVNLKNLNVDTWKINYNISKDSYIVGVYDKSVFLVDKKNKIEYEYVPSRKKIRIVGKESGKGLIYNDGYEKVLMSKLLTEDIHFDYGYSYDFILENNILFSKTENMKVLITNQNVKSIVSKGNNYVYYLVDNTLYYYDIYVGEVKVMDSFEWNFNYNNIIYPY